MFTSLTVRCMLVWAIALASMAAWAQSWKPVRPVTFTVAMAPGSSNDLIARTLSDRLSMRFGQPVVVENRAGGSGVLGVASVARSAADGHTIGIAPSNIYMTPILTPNVGGSQFDVIRDLSPIVTAGSAPVLVVASPLINVKTPAELLAYLKTGPVNYATPGIGSPMHIAGELLARATGAQLNHVAYRGVMPAVNAVLANEVPIAIITLGGIGGHIKAGKLVPVAVAERQRSELLANVPTLTESGVKGVETSVFYQIVAPAATPKPVIDRLNSEINMALTSPELKGLLRDMGVQVTGGTAEDAAKLAHSTYARNEQLVKSFGIKAE